MSTKTSKRSVRRIATAVAALGVLLASSGAAVLLSANSASAAPGDKWFVCKYTHTPGEGEVLQGGQNPISVNENAINEDPVVAGTFFSDQHGRSYVLVQDTGQDEPDPSECPPPNPDVLISVDVVFVDPDCDNDNTASYSVTGDTDNATVEESAAPAPGVEVTVTATANDDFTFEGPAETYSETHTFADAEDCEVVEPPVVEPPVVEPPVVEPPAATPTIVHAGLIGTPVADLRTEQGMALLAAGLLLMVVAGGIALPRGARR